MSGSNEQIVSLFEDSGLSPEQIAEQLGYDLTAIKAILGQYSTLFRKEARKDSTLDFNDTEQEEMKIIILNLARYSEDEHLQFKAARYVRDDSKGRLDVGAMPQLNLNQTVVNFNIHLQKALAAQKRIEQTPIDIKEVAVNE